jgi:hypothetical protein
MANETEYAVVKFFSYGKYSTCSKNNKAKAQVSLFVVGQEMSIQWTPKKVEKGAVDFANVSDYLKRLKRAVYGNHRPIIRLG